LGCSESLFELLDEPVWGMPAWQPRSAGRDGEVYFFNSKFYANGADTGFITRLGNNNWELAPSKSDMARRAHRDAFVRCAPAGFTPGLFGSWLQEVAAELVDHHADVELDGHAKVTGGELGEQSLKEMCGSLVHRLSRLGDSMTLAAAVSSGVGDAEFPATLRSIAEPGSICGDKAQSLQNSCDRYNKWQRLSDALKGRADDATAWPQPSTTTTTRTQTAQSTTQVVQPIPVVPPNPQPPSPPSSLQYSCDEGQGAWGQSYASSPHNSWLGCASECDRDPLCGAFDFTRWSSVADACRFYYGTAMKHRMGIGGKQGRRFCKRNSEPCFRHGYKWVPLDMPGSERSYERDARACQARCARTQGCSHFTYWQFFGLDGGCHLQGHEARQVVDPASMGLGISGPRSCERTSVQADTIPTVPTSTPATCFERGFKMEPLDMVATERSRETSAEACQARCARTAGCRYFTFWIDGGCHVQDKFGKRVWDPLSLGTGVIGPRVC